MLNRPNKFSVSNRLFVLAGTFVLVAGLAACKQGEGERCQVTADCETGLTCSAATKLCQTSASGGDASFTPDANVDASTAPDASPDAPPAPIDASVDAAVDAAN